MNEKDILKEIKHWKLLFVDDDDVTRVFGKNFFENIFEKVDTARSSQEAKELLKKYEYDLVITDINMPDESGIELIKHIKKEYPDTYVVVLSAHYDTDTLIEAINSDVDGFMIKPFMMDHFLKVMNKILKHKFDFADEINILRQYKKIVDDNLIVSKTDLQGNITYVNKAFEDISGFEKEELLGKPHNIVRHPDVKPEVFKQMWATIKNKRIWRGIIKNRKKNGESYYVDSVVMPILDREGNIKEFIALRKDITNLMNAESLIQDKLNLVDEALLILVKIESYNDLRVVYDDEMLKKLKRKMLKRLRGLLNKENLKVSEEYIVKDDVLGYLVENFDKEHLFEKISEVLVEVMNHSIVVNGFEYYPLVRISYAYGKMDIYKNALIGLEEYADAENRVVFANGLCRKKKIEVLKNMEMLKKVEYALNNNKVISLFQPIIDNATKKVIKYESLVRIIDEDGKMLSPFFFLDIAKKAGLYGKITFKVLENTFKFYSEKRKPITINLSPNDILRESIREKIVLLLEKCQPKQGDITFELLEDEIIKFPNTLKQFIKEVKKYNCEVAIDDFGSGYSNFSRVVDIEADIIKIDGELIKNIHKDSVKQDIVEAIVNFAKKENKKTVAEFVENKEVFDILVKLGVDYSQGYYFSPPMNSFDI